MLTSCRTVAETQIPPTVIAVAAMLAIILRGNATIMFFFIFAPKIHAICLFAVLNGRADYRNGPTQGSGVVSVSVGWISISGYSIS